MTRLCLTNDKHGISSGVFFDHQYAEQARTMLEEEFPGTTWNITPLEHGFRPEGYRHLGEHDMRRKLSRERDEANTEEATAEAGT